MSASPVFLVGHRSVRSFGIKLVIALFFGFFLGTSISADAHALSAETLCPSSAKYREPRVSPEPDDRLPAEGDLTNEIGTLANCVGPVSRTNDSIQNVSPATTRATADYFVYFDAATVSGRDLYGEGSVFEVTITGAPGAAGWYVKAFENVNNGSSVSQTYGGNPAGIGLFNYGAPRTDATGRSDLFQPARTGTIQSPAPTYSVTYGFTPKTSQRANIEANGLVIYLGVLGSTSSSAAGAVDIVNSVTLRHFVATPTPVTPPPPADPAIGLSVGVAAGAPSEGRLVDYVGFNMRPSSLYSLVLQPTGQVLAEGVVGASGRFSGRPGLPALGPGNYTVVLTATGEDGKTYQLSQSFSVDENTVVQSISDPAGSIRPATPTTLPVTGSETSWLAGSTIALVLSGLVLFMVGRHRARAVSHQLVGSDV